MTDTKICLRIIKRCRVHGELIDVDTILWLDPLDAAGLLSANFAEAVEPDAAKASFASFNAHTLRACGREPPNGSQPASWATWQPGNGYAATRH